MPNTGNTVTSKHLSFGFNFKLPFLSFILSLTLLNLLFDRAQAYIPASPANGSFIPADLQAPTGLPPAQFNLQWPGGSYDQLVIKQLFGVNSSGVNKGVLLHFSEENLSGDITTTPWIAFISCDRNASDASEVDDIFSLASKRGATAALLYTFYSDQCNPTPAYLSQAQFPIDVYYVPTKTSALLIDSQFRQTNGTAYGQYDPDLLNVASASINETITSGTVHERGFLFATLSGYGPTTPPGSGSGGGGHNGSDGGGAGMNGNQSASGGGGTGKDNGNGNTTDASGSGQNNSGEMPGATLPMIILGVALAVLPFAVPF